MTAMQRPLFFRHPARVPKADLCDEEYEDLQRLEERRAKEGAATR